MAYSVQDPARNQIGVLQDNSRPAQALIAESVRYGG